MRRRFSNSQGFTLIEALIAMALSGVVLAMATSVFVAQSRFYRDVTERSKLQDNVRSTAEVVAADIRALNEGSVLFASATHLIARVPVYMGVACGAAANDHHTYFPLDGKTVAEGDKTGVGVLWTTGQWEYFDYDWAMLYGGAGEPGTVVSCAGVGVDTVGVPHSDFVRLTIPPLSGGNWLLPGLPIILYSQTELRFMGSYLQPGRIGLFRGVTPDPIEFATGFSANSKFAYKLNGAWTSNVSGADTPKIKAIRVTIEASSENIGTGPANYGWTIDVTLRNITGAFGIP